MLRQLPKTASSPSSELRDTKKAKELLEVKNKQLEESKSAMMNIMEDLEAARAVIELEKAKDDAMLASLGEGLIAVDNNRKVMVVNKSAEEMLGWKRT